VGGTWDETQREALRRIGRIAASMLPATEPRAEPLALA
jgi:hypothetical protein